LLFNFNCAVFYFVKFHYSFLKKRVKSPNYEIGEMEEDAVLCEKSGTIAAKIAALKTNGEMNWKKRICKPIMKKVLVDESDNHRNIEIAANNKVCVPI